MWQAKAGEVRAGEDLPLERWQLVESDPERARTLASALGLPPVVARILVARGVGDPEAARAFLAPALASGIPDPFRLAGMDAAVDRLVGALEADEPVVVYGDYDVDGVTSTASLVSFLRAVGGRADAYIPRRLEEGYGLNLGAVERLAGEGARLLVTVDCGVTATEEVERAAALGVDVIIVDHHRVPTVLPRAVAVLNPYQPGCGYPYQHLAAVGVTFLLLMALRRRLRERGWFEARGLVEPRLVDWLDLVALGTVADVVPLTEVNRVLVTHGLDRLGRGLRPGVVALREVGGAEGETVSAGEVGFRLGPRINAAGRLSDAAAGLSLLLSDGPAEAARLAGLLDAANQERREIERALVEAATTQAEAQVAGGAWALVLWGEGWHRGVVGIVASRMVERFHRPALVLGVEDGAARGSGRSVPGLDLHAALSDCAGHLTRFGGHRAAAGFELPVAALAAFREAFEAACVARLTEEDLVPLRRLDAEVDPADLDRTLHDHLAALAPFGMGNPTPVLLARGVRLDQARVVGQGAPGHLKARLGRLDLIGFGLGDRLDLCGGDVDLLFTLGVDRWQGRERLQAKALSVQPTGRVEVRSGGAEATAAGHVHV